MKTLIIFLIVIVFVVCGILLAYADVYKKSGHWFACMLVGCFFGFFITRLGVNLWLGALILIGCLLLMFCTEMICGRILGRMRLTRILAQRARLLSERQAHCAHDWKRVRLIYSDTDPSGELPGIICRCLRCGKEQEFPLSKQNLFKD